MNSVDRGVRLRQAGRLRFLGVLLILSAIAWAVPLGSTGWAGILAAGLFAATVVLGAGFLAAVSVLSGAIWWLPTRAAVSALLRAIIPAVLVLLAVLVFGLDSLYPWAYAAGSAHSPILQAKSVWLNAPLFLARALVIVVVWVSIARALTAAIETSAKQVSGPLQGRAVRSSLLYVIAFAITICLAFGDWGMSLDPEWFSSIYGVYGFAAAFRAGIAAVAVLCLSYPRLTSGRMRVEVSVRQSLGALLFAFSMFWAYIWVSQYLLIWYADLPEESGWYLQRLSAGWSLPFWLVLVLGFVVPFLALMNSQAKKDPWTLTNISWIVLVAHWLDMLVLAGGSEGPFTLSIVSISLLAVVGWSLLFFAGLPDTLLPWCSIRQDATADSDRSPIPATVEQEGARGR